MWKLLRQNTLRTRLHRPSFLCFQTMPPGTCQDCGHGSHSSKSKTGNRPNQVWIPPRKQKTGSQEGKTFSTTMQIQQDLLEAFKPSQPQLEADSAKPSLGHVAGSDADKALGSIRSHFLGPDPTLGFFFSFSATWNSCTVCLSTNLSLALPVAWKSVSC